HRPGIIGPADDAERLAGVAPAAHVARDLSVERRRDTANEFTCPVDQQPLARAWLVAPGQRLDQARLGLGADAGDVAQAPLRRGLAELRGAPDAEVPGELDGALGAEAEVAAEAD